MTPYSKSALFAAMVGLCVTAGSALPLVGQEVRIQELRPLSPGGTVRVEAVLHSIVVEVWDRREVEVTGTYEASLETLEVDSDATSFTLELDRLENRGRGGGGTLTLRVPTGVELRVESVTGEVQVTGDLGPVIGESVSGSVTYVGDAPEVRLGSISGSVSYTGTTDEAAFESVSGSVRVQGNLGAVDAASTSGTITVTSGTPLRELDLQAVSGRVTFTGSLAPGGEMALESFSGGIDLALDPATAATFELETFSGSIRVQLPGVAEDVVQRGRVGPARSARFVTGNGAGSIEASTMSGSIVVRTP